MTMSPTQSPRVQEGVLAPCPLQMKTKEKPSLKLNININGYDSDLSPLTTGPSSAASSVSLDDMDLEQTHALAFPEPDEAYKSYHNKTFLAPQLETALYKEISVSDASDEEEQESDMITKPDCPETAMRIIRNNRLTPELFDAVCPSNLNEKSVFLYGKLASPTLLGELLANNGNYRAYEQAARMYPATLKNYSIGTIGETTVTSIVPEQGAAVEGFVLFSTSIRERQLIKGAKGKAFEELNTHASVKVNGVDLSIPVESSMATEQWREHVIVA